MDYQNELREMDLQLGDCLLDKYRAEKKVRIAIQYFKTLVPMVESDEAQAIMHRAIHELEQ